MFFNFSRLDVHNGSYLIVAIYDEASENIKLEIQASHDLVINFRTAYLLIPLLNS